jgi:selT/selW/selH-like putative selenoprotein
MIVGSNYPLTPLRQFLVQFIGLLQMLLLGGVLFSNRLFDILGIPPQEWIRDNKWGTCIGIWLVGNFLSSNVGSTGAFEIAYDGQMVFSKLNSGRMPAIPEIFSAIDAIRSQK